MKWILIIWFVFERGSGLAAPEFNTQDACEKAGAAVFQTTRMRGSPQAPPSGNWICVPKG